ncbi:MBL fold metallo-hydrolase [Stetteria hydrogenophila]
MVEVRVVDVTPEEMGDRLISAFLVIGGERSALIDPGPESSRGKLLSELESLGVKPDYIILTHIHLDHGGSAGGLARSLPGARILVHPRGAKHLVDPSKLWSASRQVLGRIAEVFGKPVPAPADAVVEAQDGGVVELGGATLRIIYTPGHASHHMSILLEEDGTLFTGDSAGVIAGRGGYKVMVPTTPPPFRFDLYVKSLERIIELKPAYVAPTHYGLHAADGYLERHLAQIREWVRVAGEADVESVDELAAILAGVDDNVKLLLGVPELRPLKEVFLDPTLAGILDYIARARASSS